MAPVNPVSPIRSEHHALQLSVTAIIPRQRVFYRAVDCARDSNENRGRRGPRRGAISAPMIYTTFDVSRGKKSDRPRSRSGPDALSDPLISARGIDPVAFSPVDRNLHAIPDLGAASLMNFHCRTLQREFSSLEKSRYKYIRSPVNLQSPVNPKRRGSCSYNAVVYSPIPGSTTNKALERIDRATNPNKIP